MHAPNARNKLFIWEFVSRDHKMDGFADAFDRAEQVAKF